MPAQTAWPTVAVLSRKQLVINSPAGSLINNPGSAIRVLARFAFVIYRNAG